MNITHSPGMIPTVLCSPTGLMRSACPVRFGTVDSLKLAPNNSISKFVTVNPGSKASEGFRKQVEAGITRALMALPAQKRKEVLDSGMKVLIIESPKSEKTAFLRDLYPDEGSRIAIAKLKEWSQLDTEEAFLDAFQRCTPTPGMVKALEEALHHSVGDGIIERLRYYFARQEEFINFLNQHTNDKTGPHYNRITKRIVIPETMDDSDMAQYFNFLTQYREKTAIMSMLESTLALQDEVNCLLSGKRYKAKKRPKGVDVLPEGPKPKVKLDMNWWKNIIGDQALFDRVINHELWHGIADLPTFGIRSCRGDLAAKDLFRKALLKEMARLPESLRKQTLLPNDLGINLGYYFPFETPTERHYDEAFAEIGATSTLGGSCDPEMVRRHFKKTMPVVRHLAFGEPLPSPNPLVRLGLGFLNLFSRRRPGAAQA